MPSGNTVSSLLNRHRSAVIVVPTVLLLVTLYHIFKGRRRRLSAPPTQPKDEETSHINEEGATMPAEICEPIARVSGAMESLSVKSPSSVSSDSTINSCTTQLDRLDVASEKVNGDSSTENLLSSQSEVGLTSKIVDNASVLSTQSSPPPEVIGVSLKKANGNQRESPKKSPRRGQDKKSASPKLQARNDDKKTSSSSLHNKKTDEVIVKTENNNTRSAAPKQQQQRYSERRDSNGVVDETTGRKSGNKMADSVELGGGDAGRSRKDGVGALAAPQTTSVGERKRRRSSTNCQDAGFDPDDEVGGVVEDDDGSVSPRHNGAFSDAHSEGSSDSGKGGSDIQTIGGHNAVEANGSCIGSPSGESSALTESVTTSAATSGSTAVTSGASRTTTKSGSAARAHNVVTSSHSGADNNNSVSSNNNSSSSASAVAPPVAPSGSTSHKHQNGHVTSAPAAAMVVGSAAAPPPSSNVHHPAGVGQYTTFEFEIPSVICGRLIGKYGVFVKQLKQDTNANVIVNPHPYDPETKLCVVEGTQKEIDAALSMIRRRFPKRLFPTLTLAQVHLHYATATPAALLAHTPWGAGPGGVTPTTAAVLPMPETLQLQLPAAPGVSCDVVVTSVVSAGHFFVQQPTHPTYPSLASLDHSMLTCYGGVNENDDSRPPLPTPIEAGMICAAPMMNGWFRSIVVATFNGSSEVEVRFVDYGGYMRIDGSRLRQIRSDFMTLPFQATECNLASVEPLNATEGWSDASTSLFEELAQGHILQGMVVGFNEQSMPLLHLFRSNSQNESVFINRELVDRGVARWVELNVDSNGVTVI